MLQDYAFSCRACLAAFLAVVTCLCMLERLFNPSMPLQAQATQQQSAESDTSLPITSRSKGPFAEPLAALPSHMQSRLGPAASQVRPPKPYLAEERHQATMSPVSSQTSAPMAALPLGLQRRLTPAATHAAQFTKQQQHAGQGFGLGGSRPQGFPATSSRGSTNPQGLDNWAHGTAEQETKEAAEQQDTQHQRPNKSGGEALLQVEARVAALQSEQQQHRKRSNRYRGTRGGVRRCVC